MLRLLGAGILLLLGAEVLLGLAFWAGCAWLGGPAAGAVLAAVVLVVALLPWVGEVRAEFDSQTRELLARVSWWASARVSFTAEPELRLRVLGIPYRRKLRKRPPAAAAAAPARKPAPRPKARRRLDPRDLLRFALAGVLAAGELLVETRQVSVTVNAPAEIDVVDQIIAGVVGRRTLGPVDFQVLPEGTRRVRLRYRIGLAKCLGAGLFVLIQGRAWRVGRSR
jgi:hypothetical protein